MAKKSSKKRVSKSPAAMSISLGVVLAIIVGFGLWHLNQISLNSSAREVTTNKAATTEAKQLKDDKDLQDLDTTMNSVDGDKDFGTESFTDLEAQ